MFGHIKVANETGNPSDFVVQIRGRMRRAHEVARRHLEANAKRSKEVYDARLSFHKYEVGDMVWLLHETRRVGISAKVQKAFDGPFLVKLVKVKISEINFVIQLRKKARRK
ncbi:hypothetical protein DPMN_014731 [Dreissena polymorpha]|uniref:Uncharacterized protein n=1 Tax=Dreissena polymorpha TaxID=45954 RepID=A0A9D4N9S2_DREPO|nr:hypothetical protein DPMN_014731 [Dreissena polymorpha]